jgi:hypothetical protein
MVTGITRTLAAGKITPLSSKGPSTAQMVSQLVEVNLTVVAIFNQDSFLCLCLSV